MIHDESLPQDLCMLYTAKLASLPRVSSKVRVRNRCVVTGRGRGVSRFFVCHVSSFETLRLKAFLQVLQK